MGVSLYVPDSNHSVDMRYSVLSELKRVLIEQTLRVLEQTSTHPDAVAELRKWIASAAPLSTAQKMQFCVANGFPANMALDPSFAAIITQSIATLNIGVIPTSCPPSLIDAQLAGVHAFVRHSDCEGDYTKGQCVDITDWFQLLATHSDKCDFVDYSEVTKEVMDLFAIAVRAKQCVRIG